MAEVKITRSSGEEVPLGIEIGPLGAGAEGESMRRVPNDDHLSTVQALAEVANALWAIHDRLGNLDYTQLQGAVESLEATLKDQLGHIVQGQRSGNDTLLDILSVVPRR